MNKQQIDNLPKSGGVYIIRNTETGMVYVGMAGKIRQRLRQLWCLYEYNIRTTPLLEDLCSYTPDVFELHVISVSHSPLLGINRHNVQRVYNEELSKHTSLYEETPYLDTVIEVASRYKDLWCSEDFWDFKNWVTSMNYYSESEYTEPGISYMVERLMTTSDDILKSIEDKDYLINDKYRIRYFISTETQTI